MEATLSDKVAALRSFFGVDQSMPLLSALQAMHSSDGQRAPGGGMRIARRCPMNVPTRARPD
jgi:hypothetical protein